MHTHKNQLIELLKALKKQGQKSIFVHPSTLTQLQSSLFTLAPNTVSTQFQTTESFLNTQSIFKESSTFSEKWDQLKSWVIQRYKEKNLESTTLVFGNGPFKPTLLLFTDFPAISNYENQKIFSEEENTLWKKILLAMNIDENKVFFSSAFPWSSKIAEKNTPNDIKNYLLDLSRIYCETAIKIIEPKIIIILSNKVGQNLLNLPEETTFAQLQSHNFQQHNFPIFNQIPFCCTYHPNYILNSQHTKAKRLLWEDMQRVMQYL